MMMSEASLPTDGGQHIAARRYGGRLVRLFLTAGVLAAGGVFAAAVTVATAEPQTSSHLDEAQAQILVDLAESEVTRRLHRDIAVLDKLGGVLSSQLPSPDTTSNLLRNVLASAPSMCAILLLDGDGHVFASTRAGERGQAVNVHTLSPMPAAGLSVVGDFAVGRGTQDLRPDVHNAGPRSTAGAVVLLHTIAGRRGAPMHIVALLKPEALLTDSAAHKGQPGFSYSLATRYGQIVASTETSPSIYERANAMPVFRAQHIETAAGSYVGRGVQGSQQVVAFRHLKDFPMVLIGETSVELVKASAQNSLMRLLWAGIGASCSFFLLAFLLRRPGHLAIEGQPCS